MTDLKKEEKYTQVERLTFANNCVIVEHKYKTNSVRLSVIQYYYLFFCEHEHDAADYVIIIFAELIWKLERNGQWQEEIGRGQKQTMKSDITRTATNTATPSKMRRECFPFDSLNSELL